MNRREQAALLLALRDSERGWTDVTNAVEEAGSALAVLESLLTPDQPTLDHATPDVACRLELVEKEIESWADEGIHLVTVLDELYPVQLLMVHQRPPFLTCKGFLDPADQFGVAVVGSRHASARGLHAELQQEIARTGAVVSQFWPDAGLAKHHFPMRNAVMSGCSVATVVVEAGEHSGTRIQARLALEHGRHVFLLPEVVSGTTWGSEMSERPNTTVLEGPDHLAAAFSTDIATFWFHRLLAARTCASRADAPRMGSNGAGNATSTFRRSALILPMKSCRSRSPRRTGSWPASSFSTRTASPRTSGGSSPTSSRTSSRPSSHDTRTFWAKSTS